MLTANKTRCLQYFFFLLLLAPQVSKRVDDDTKDEVEDDNDDHEEEEQVVDHPGCEKGLLMKPNRREHVKTGKISWCYNGNMGPIDLLCIMYLIHLQIF